MVIGPDLARMIEECGTETDSFKNENGIIESSHCEQRLLQEKWFQQLVKKLIDIMKATNSFQMNSGYFVNFGGRAATDERAVISIKSLERITVKNSIISSAVMLLKL